MNAYATFLVDPEARCAQCDTLIFEANQHVLDGFCIATAERVFCSRRCEKESERVDRENDTGTD